jgi:hypothetical protein
MTQPTYEGSGRQGTHYNQGSKTRVKSRSPAFPVYKPTIFYYLP